MVEFLRFFEGQASLRDLDVLLLFSLGLTAHYLEDYLVLELWPTPETPLLVDLI